MRCPARQKIEGHSRNGARLRGTVQRQHREVHRSLRRQSQPGQRWRPLDGGSRGNDMKQTQSYVMMCLKMRYTPPNRVAIFQCEHDDQLINGCTDVPGKFKWAFAMSLAACHVP